MDEIIDTLRVCKTPEEIKDVMDYYISESVKRSKESNRGETTIGRYLSVNPKYELNVFEDLCPKVNNRWIGYVPIGTRVVYKSVLHGMHGSNDGGYYYVDDESYIYEFADYIRDKKVKDENYFILFVDKFIHNYLERMINPADREQIHKLIIGMDGRCFAPIKEHFLSDFVGNGAAMCSEYAVVAQNLMSVFGFESEIIFDTAHAFNIFVDSDGDVNVLDFSNRIKYFDVNMRLLRKVPFVETIDDFTDEMYDEFLYGDRKFRFDNYHVMDMPNSTLILSEDLVRVYGADGKISEGENKLILRKKK